MAATLGRVWKDPEDVTPVTVDFAAWLGSATISTSGFTVPSGLTRDSQSDDSTTATATLSGGTAGKSYDVHCDVTDSGAREKRVTFQVMLRRR